MSKKTLTLKRTRPDSENDNNSDEQKPLALKRKRRIVVNPNAGQAKPQQAAKPAKKVKKKQSKPKAAASKKTPPSEIKAAELNALLSERFATWRTHQPLAIGVHKDIHRLISAEQLPYSKRVVQKVLRRHVQHESYLNQLQKQSERVGLQS